MKILIIGAYGYTGRLICEELFDKQIDFSIAGKNESKLQALMDEFDVIKSFLIADLSNEASIKEVVASSDVFVNCAGPFTEESAGFVDKIALSGKIYLDITGELGFVKSSREKLHEKCLNHNSLIIHSVAFESMIVDLALQVISKENENRNIEVFYQFNNYKVSPGTKITMKISKFRESLHVKNGEWSKFDSKSLIHKVKIKDVDYSGIPYPLPEIAFSKWSYGVENISTYLLADPEMALYYQPSRFDPEKIDKTLSKLKSVKKHGPSTEQRENQKCQVFLKVDNLFWSIKTKNMYQLTAECVRDVIVELKKNRNPYGVLNPAKIFKNKEIDTLNNLDVTIEKELI
jgi:short subunit dehydrogenase-like uncharacterized protein